MAPGPPAGAAAPPALARSPAPVDPAIGERTPPPLGVARTEFQPPPPASPPAPLAPASGEIKSSIDRPGGAAVIIPASAKKSGIPWNDSPKMPAPITPPPAFQLPPNPLTNPAAASAARDPATAPGVPRPIAAAVNGGGGTPPIGNMAQSPAAAPPASGGAGPSGEVLCPSCGRPIAPGFAFCGSCGTRIAPVAAGGAPPTAGAPRTIFMAGSSAMPGSAPRGRLVLIRPDGSEGGVHPLNEGENMVGRGQGSLFDSDAYLSPRHGEFTIGPDGVAVRDLRSLNGVFLKISQEEPLESGDIFRIGQELLRFEVISAPQPLEDGTEVMGTPNPGFWGRLSVVVGRDVDGSAFPLFGDAIILGRERGDILFPEDGYVSGAHARISLNEGQVYLADLGSSNGTFLRIRGERLVPPGSFVLMGQQLFRVELNQ
jgi:pSer/pThr/pTyr-binding forkhead associated (FHA) protein